MRLESSLVKRMQSPGYFWRMMMKHKPKESGRRGRACGMLVQKDTLLLGNALTGQAEEEEEARR